MEFVFGFLGGLASWPALIILLECAAIIVCIERGSGIMAGISVVIALALLYFIAGINPFTYVIEHPFGTILYFAAYIATGIVWSVFRLDRFAKQWRRTWNEADNKSARRALFGEQPTVKNNKDRLLAWIIFWPWSVLWWALADLVFDFMNTIYEMMSGIYSKVIARHMDGVVHPDTQDDNETRGRDGKVSGAA